MQKLKQHPLSAAFPEMLESDYQALKDSIENIGVQNPITLFEGMVIDGWHRYRAASEIGASCPSVDLGDVDPQEFVLAQIKARRHITQSQLALAASSVYQWMPLGSNQHGGSAPGAYPQKTEKEMANIAGVGERTIRQAKKVQTDAAPEVVDAVKRGDIGLKKAEAISKLPKKEQAEALKKPMPKKSDAPISQEEADAAMADGLPTYEELLEENARLTDIVESIQSDDPEAEVKKQVGIANYYKGEYNRMKNAENELIAQIKRHNKFIDDIRKLTGLDRNASFSEIIRTLKDMVRQPA